MFKNRLSIMFATTLLCAANVASAQDYYGSVFGGLSQFADDTALSGDITSPAGTASQSVGIESNDGRSYGIALGRTFGDFGIASLRGEIELSYSDQDADNTFFTGNDATQGGGPEANTAGGVATTRLFANAYADFQTGSAITPFIGAGLGVSRSEFDISYGPGVNLTDESDNTSGQLIAGASYDFGDGYSVFGDVRFIRDFDVETDRLAPNGNLTGVISDDIDTVSFNLGVSFTF